MRIGVAMLISIFSLPLLLKGEEAIVKSDTVSFTLEVALEWAVKHNEGILAERSKVKEAENGIGVARAGFFPKINGQLSYTRLAEMASISMEAPVYGTMQVPVFNPFGDTIGFTFVPGVVGADTIEFSMGSDENYLVRASLRQPIFTFGKLLDAYNIAKLNFEAAEQDCRKSENDLILGVKKAFYGILILKELVEVSDESYKQTKRHIEAVKKRYEVGLSSDFDLLRAEVQLKNMEPNLAKARNGYNLAQKGFKTMIGLPQDSHIAVVGKLTYEPIEVNLETLVLEAKVHRPELLALSLRKKITEKAQSIASKANLPNLALIANYDYKKPVYFSNEWGKDWSVTVALQMPIFTGFENTERKYQAREKTRQVNHYLKLLGENIELDVRSACLKLREAGKLVESQEENVKQAMKAEQIVERRFEQGLATNLEVMDTELALLAAKTNYLRALSDYLISKAELYRAVGK